MVDSGYLRNLLPILGNGIDIPLSTLKPLVASLLNLTVDHHGKYREKILLTCPGPSAKELVSHWEDLLQLSLLDPSNALSVPDGSDQDRGFIAQWLWSVLTMVSEEGEQRRVPR